MLRFVKCFLLLIAMIFGWLVATATVTAQEWQSIEIRQKIIYTTLGQDGCRFGNCPTPVFEEKKAVVTESNVVFESETYVQPVEAKIVLYEQPVFRSGGHLLGKIRKRFRYRMRAWRDRPGLFGWRHRMINGWN